LIPENIDKRVNRVFVDFNYVEEIFCAQIEGLIKLVVSNSSFSHCRLWEINEQIKANGVLVTNIAFSPITTIALIMNLIDL